ncbi:hypothetical protein [Rhabdonatronobacter sediminivivens]|nr:hypothetical protein [Rhabdonatronobacter sediminivivens]
MPRGTELAKAIRRQGKARGVYGTARPCRIPVQFFNAVCILKIDTMSGKNEFAYGSVLNMLGHENERTLCSPWGGPKQPLRIFEA